MSVLQLPKHNPKDVRVEIVRIATQRTDRVFLVEHAKDRAIERGVTLKQIFKVLRIGEQIGAVEWDDGFQKGYRCRMQRVVAGVNISVVAKLVDEGDDCCVVITVWEG